MNKKMENYVFIDADGKYFLNKKSSLWSFILSSFAI